MWSVVDEQHCTIVASTDRLSDDIIDYIGPSLEEYKGCDIIDIHPGACLWSTKLHDFLKPRRHLLMEPHDRYYDPFIKPLLEQPNSTYRHTYMSGAHPKSYWASYDKIFNDDLLPKRESLHRDDPKLRQPNRTLLVTGILPRRYSEYRSTISNRASETTLVLNHFAMAAQSNTMFHAYGLVRMLLWTPEDVKHIIQPLGMWGRSALNVILDMCMDVHVVAGASQKSNSQMTMAFQANRRRPDRHTAYSADLVLNRMKAEGIELPPDRSSPEHEAAIERRRASAPLTKAHGWGTNWLSDLPRSALKPELKAIKSEAETLLMLYRSQKSPFKAASNDDYYGYDMPTDSSRPLVGGPRARGAAFVGLVGRQLKAERSWFNQSSHLPAEMRDQLQAQLAEISTTIKDIRDAMRLDIVYRCEEMIDEECGLYLDPPMLGVDRRPREPIAGSREDFHPEYPLCLIDAQPRSHNMASDITSAEEGSMVMREMIRSLFTKFKDPLPLALDKVAPNAGSSLIPTLPILTDPTRGGRIHPNDLRVRMLTREMLDQLVTAYLEWPFRLSTAELAAQMDDSTESSDGEEVVPGMEEVDDEQT